MPETYFVSTVPAVSRVTHELPSLENVQLQKD